MTETPRDKTGTPALRRCFLLLRRDGRNAPQRRGSKLKGGCGVPPQEHMGMGFGAVRDGHRPGAGCSHRSAWRCGSVACGPAACGFASAGVCAPAPARAPVGCGAGTPGRPGERS